MIKKTKVLSQLLEEVIKIVLRLNDIGESVALRRKWFDQNMKGPYSLIASRDIRATRANHSQFRS